MTSVPTTSTSTVSTRKQQQIHSMDNLNQNVEQLSQQRLMGFGRCYFYAIPDTTLKKIRRRRKKDNGYRSSKIDNVNHDNNNNDENLRGDRMESDLDNSEIDIETEIILVGNKNFEVYDNFNHIVEEEEEGNVFVDDGDDKNNCVPTAQWENDVPPWAANQNNTYGDGQYIQQIACTSQSSLFLTGSGKVYQQGLLHGYHLPNPTKIDIPLPLRCVQISAGRHFCLALMEGGVAVVSWGAGHFGQLGIGPNYSYHSPSNDNHGDHRHNNTNHDPITFTSTPCIIERLLPHSNDSPIISIAAGDWHALALTQSGRVWAWGCNRNLQCGRKVKSSHTNNNVGNTGAGASPSASAAASQSTATSSPAPTITVPLPVPLGPSSSTNTTFHVTHIAAGRSHSMLIARETMTSENEKDRTIQSMPVTTTKNIVYCWGNSHSGQCGNIVTRRSVPGVLPSPVESLRDVDVQQISAAGNHSMALTAQGRILCWGSHLDGQLGIGVVAASSSSYYGSISETDESTTTSISNNLLPSTSAIQCKPRLVSDLDFVAIAAGQEWTKQQIQLQLQLSTSTSRTPPASSSAASSVLSTIPRITSVHAGATYSAAVSSLGHLYVWGSNDAGQLGIPIPPKHSLPYMQEDNNALRVVVDVNAKSHGIVNNSCTMSNVLQNSSVQKQNHRVMHAQTFDSCHNVLLPLRVEILDDINVQQVACGPNHLWCVGRTRTLDDLEKSAKSIQFCKTLYEIQVEKSPCQRLALPSKPSRSIFLKTKTLSAQPQSFLERISNESVAHEKSNENETNEHTANLENNDVDDATPAGLHAIQTLSDMDNAIIESKANSTAPAAFSNNQGLSMISPTAMTEAVAGATSYTTTDIEEITETDAIDGYDEDEDDTTSRWSHSPASNTAPNPSTFLPVVPNAANVQLGQLVETASVTTPAVATLQKEEHQRRNRGRPQVRGPTLIKRLSEKFLKRRKARGNTNSITSKVAIQPVDSVDDDHDFDDVAGVKSTMSSDRLFGSRRKKGNK